MKHSNFKLCCACEILIPTQQSLSLFLALIISRYMDQNWTSYLKL